MLQFKKMFSADTRLNKQFFSSKGQGILEVIVTIAVGTIMILALVVLAVRANKASDFSKDSSQASNIASTSLEITSNLKTTNLATLGNHQLQYDGCGIPVPNFITWDTFWNTDINDESTTCNDITGAYVHPVYGRRGVIHLTYSDSAEPYCLTNDCIHISDDEYPRWYIVKIGTREFINSLYVADTPTPDLLPGSTGKSKCNITVNDYKEIKQFTIETSWTDSTGTHSQVQTRCIRR